MNHHLEITPVPEKVLYVNELEIADCSCNYELQKQYDLALTGKKKSEGGILPEDNVRIYVPFDLNTEQILNRLRYIYAVLGNLDEDNEWEFASRVRNIVTQLEIYDQAWCSRDREQSIDVNGKLHNRKAIEVAQEIVNILMENEGCAECFPYEIVEELKANFGI